MRREILTFRNDIWRANIIYGVYDVGRMAVIALRHPPAMPPQSETQTAVSSGSAIERDATGPLASLGQHFGRPTR